jgi:hypothetical protein
MAVRRVPQVKALKLISSENVQFALIARARQTQGSPLTRAEIRAVSELMTGRHRRASPSRSRPIAPSPRRLERGRVEPSLPTRVRGQLAASDVRINDIFLVLH